MPGVAVVTDSTSSLDRDAAVRAGISVIPLQVVIDGRSRPESEVPPAEVAQALRSGRPVTTSRPAPELFAGLYAGLADAGYDAIVSIHLSSHISGTCGAAQVAAGDCSIPVTVVDALTLAMGVGFAALAAARAAGAGAAAAEVAEIAVRRARSSSTYFYVDSLDYLRRGGRIGNAAALVGTALAVKPLLTVEEGEIRVHERVRTESKAVARLEELGVQAVRRASSEGLPVEVAVHHLDDPSGARRLAARLGEAVGLENIGISEISAVLGVHVGPGTLGLVVSPG